MNRTPWWGRIFSIATATSWEWYTLDVNLFTLGTYSEENRRIGTGLGNQRTAV